MSPEKMSLPTILSLDCLVVPIRVPLVPLLVELGALEPNRRQVFSGGARKVSLTDPSSASTPSWPDPRLARAGELLTQQLAAENAIRDAGDTPKGCHPASRCSSCPRPLDRGLVIEAQLSAHDLSGNIGYQAVAAEGVGA